MEKFQPADAYSIEFPSCVLYLPSFEKVGNNSAGRTKNCHPTQLFQFTYLFDRLDRVSILESLYSAKYKDSRILRLE